MAEASGRLQRAERLGYEPTDADVKAILVIVLIVVAVVCIFAAALGGMIVLFGTEAERPQVGPFAHARIEPPPPRLEAAPKQALEEVQHHEQQVLESYGWLDREAGIARIPIEQAMQLLATRGWTFRPGLDAPNSERAAGPPQAAP